MVIWDEEYSFLLSSAVQMSHVFCHGLDTRGLMETLGDAREPRVCLLCAQMCLNFCMCAESHVFGTR